MADSYIIFNIYRVVPQTLQFSFLLIWVHYMQNASGVLTYTVPQLHSQSQPKRIIWWISIQSPSWTSWFFLLFIFFYTPVGEKQGDFFVHHWSQFRSDIYWTRQPAHLFCFPIKAVQISLLRVKNVSLGLSRKWFSCPTALWGEIWDRSRFDLYGSLLGGSWSSVR